MTAAVIIEDGRVLLTRRPPDDPLEGYWELPGGKLEPGESPEDCLARELLEELAMSSEVGELLATSIFEYEHGSFELLAFGVRRTSDYHLLVHDQATWATPEEAMQMRLAPADVLLIEDLRVSGLL